MASSSSYTGKSKQKNKPIGPILIHIDGRPFGPHYDALIERIGQHVCHCDEFSPALSWSDHKNSGRVERLYMDLTELFSLPPWNNNSDINEKFCVWFNENVRHKWNDNKNRRLRRMFDLCEGSIEEASAHPLAMIDNETWTSLLLTYKKNKEDDGSGMSKSEKCRAARMANDLDHRLGRDALSVWKGKFREVLGREPNAKDIYNKEFRKIDALDAREGEQPTPRMRGKPVSTHAESLGLQLEKYYDAAIADGSDDNTTSTQATQATFGRVTRLGLQAPRGTRPARRDAYTVQLEQQLQTLSQESEVRRQESEAAITTANQRIATLEVSQRDIHRMLALLLERQQGGGDNGIEGGGDDDDTQGGDNGIEGGGDDDV